MRLLPLQDLSVLRISQDVLGEKIPRSPRIGNDPVGLTHLLYSEPIDVPQYVGTAAYSCCRL